MTAKEQFLSQRYRHRPICLPQHFSDEEMVRDWTLTQTDRQEVRKYHKHSRLSVAVQLCFVRLYGRFFNQIHEMSPQIVDYLARQLDLPTSPVVQVPNRKATYTQHRQNILKYLGFQKFDDTVQEQLVAWLKRQAQQNLLPQELFQKTEFYLLDQRILLPGPSVLEKLIIHVCSCIHQDLFQSVFQQLSPELRKSIDQFLTVPEGKQRSFFYYLKEYPPTATVSSIQLYLKRYQTLIDTGIDRFEATVLTPAFLGYCFQQAKCYKTKDLKRFSEPKRYTLMICFLLETRKTLLDHLVSMHDQCLMDMHRQVKNLHEKKHRALRKRQKKAVDVILGTTHFLLGWLEDKPLYKEELWQRVDERKLRSSLEDLHAFKRLEERGFGDSLVARYPSLRKYFAQFLHLPFASKQDCDGLIQAIEITRELDTGKLKRLPQTAPTRFIPQELQRCLKNREGNLNRNAWEMGLALAMKAALRSGDLYLPHSRQHVFFWNLVLNDTCWQREKQSAFEVLQQPQKHEMKQVLSQQFQEGIACAHKHFKRDHFAEIQEGKLKLKRDDKARLPDGVSNLQRFIDAHLPSVRIEQLLMQVDGLTRFSRHFIPLQNHPARPPHFYKTLMAAIISQATNLGVVCMSASVKGMTVDMLRHVLHHFVREETLTAANTEIVNQHHQLPLSSVYGTGTVSSSDGQRFGIRASSLLASYYPRYYGYYEKAISLYTHVSDQYSVFKTQIISCSPREAIYVLDGLLENNTILHIREHTTDTHGYTEIIFALCYLLGFYFMPRIRDLKDQQLYRLEKQKHSSVFSPLLTKTVDLNLIEEQWEEMIRVALSLKQRTAPAHVVIRRLTNSFPSDRLSKAITNLGRIIKTQYILRYLTDLGLRQTVQLQLNKGEYRHRLPRRIFFADQGEFTTGDYEEIMNKASCLSLVSNAILYWNTIKISEILENLRARGENIDKQALSHISLLPFKHVVPSGTYFIDDP